MSEEAVPQSPAGGARPVRRFARDRRGTAAVEFALVAMPFFYMLFATLETTTIYLAQTTLDFSINSVQRQIRTGQAQRAGRTAADMKALVCQNMRLMLNPDCDKDVWLDVDSFPSLTGLNAIAPIANGDVDPAQMSYDPGGPDSIVLVRAYYAWKIRTPFLSAALSNISGDRRLISSARLMRVEPYPTGGGAAP